MSNRSTVLICNLLFWANGALEELRLLLSIVIYPTKRARNKPPSEAYSELDGVVHRA